MVVEEDSIFSKPETFFSFVKINALDLVKNSTKRKRIEEYIFFLNFSQDEEENKLKAAPKFLIDIFVKSLDEGLKLAEPPKKQIEEEDNMIVENVNINNEFKILDNHFFRLPITLEEFNIFVYKIAPLIFGSKIQEKDWYPKISKVESSYRFRVVSKNVVPILTSSSIKGIFGARLHEIFVEEENEFFKKITFSVSLQTFSPPKIVEIYMLKSPESFVNHLLYIFNKNFSYRFLSKMYSKTLLNTKASKIDIDKNFDKIVDFNTFYLQGDSIKDFWFSVFSYDNDYISNNIVETIILDTSENFMYVPFQEINTAIERVKEDHNYYNPGTHTKRVDRDFNLEVECRFKDVDKQSYENLLQTLLLITDKKSILKEKTISKNYKTELKGEQLRYIENIETGKHHYEMKKSLIRNIRTPDLNLVFGVSLEEKISYSYLFGANNLTLIRNKDRTSFFVGDKNIRIDLTIVTEMIPGEEGGEAVAPSPTYEVEVEMITLDNNLQFKNTIKNVFKWLNQTNFIYPIQEKYDVINSFNKNVLYPLTPSSENFREPKRNEMGKLFLFKPARDISNKNIITEFKALNDYNISIKADGESRNLFFGKYGIYLLAGRNYVSKVFSYNMEDNLEKDFSKKFYLTTLMGEFIPRSKRSDDKTIDTLFAAFDFLYLRNDIFHLSYAERHSAMTKEIEDHLNPFLSRSSVLKIFPKPIVSLKSDTPQKLGEKIIDFFFEDTSSYPFYNDGVILTPNDIKKPIFKLKPKHMLSIDFRINIDSKKVYTEEGNEFVGTNEFPFDSEINVDWDSLDPVSKDITKYSILEFVPTFLEEKDGGKNLKLVIYRYNRLRQDKQTANSKGTAGDVWDKVNTDKTPIDMFSMKDNMFRVFKYHNIIKRKLITNSLYKVLDRKSTLIVDIGSGWGADIDKYISLFQNSKVKNHIIFSDISEENLSEFRSRMKSFSSSGFLPFSYSILNIGGEKHVEILNEVNRLQKTFKFDNVVITMMLTLSFFFTDDNDMYYNLLRTFSNLRKVFSKKFYFAFFTVDGESVKDVIGKYGIQDRLINKNYQMILYPEENKVVVNINNTIVTNQTEYLVDLNRLLFNSLQLKKTRDVILLDKEIDKENEDLFLSNEEMNYNKMYTVGLVEIPHEFSEFLTEEDIQSFNTYADKVDALSKDENDYFEKFLKLYPVEFVTSENLNSKSKTKKKKISLEDAVSSLVFPKEVNTLFDRITYENNVVLDNMYPYFILSQHLKKKFKSKNISNAWLKLYEMLNFLQNEKHVSFGKKRGGTYKAFCNAEFPGSFILALDFFLLNNYDIKLEWKGSSLIDSNSGALLDKYGLFKKYPQNWIMNDTTFDGDVTKYENLLYIDKYFSSSGKVDIYTSDIGVEEKDRSEELLIQLELGQDLFGFLSLNKGGFFITKHFLRENSPYLFSSFYEKSLLFEKSFVVKPATSKTPNDEVYFIGVGFKGFLPAKKKKWLDFAKYQFSKGGDKEVLLSDKNKIPPESLEELMTVFNHILTKKNKILTLLLAESLKYFEGNVYVNSLTRNVFTPMLEKWLKMYPIHIEKDYYLP